MQSDVRGGRAVWVRVIVITAIWALFATMFALEWRGDRQIWDRVFTVPVMARPFADLSQVSAAVESIRHGLNPYVTNPYDMSQRRFIYPRVWLYLFAAAKITPQRIIEAGALVAILYLSAVSWLVWRQQQPWTSVFIGLAACSSAAAMAVERGNTDILIFCLVLVAISIESRGSTWILIAASILKVYPFFALLGEAAAGRRTRLLLLALPLAAAGILAQHGDFTHQENSIPHGYGLKEIDVAMEKASPALKAGFAAHKLPFRLLWAFVLATIAGSGVVLGAVLRARTALLASSRWTYGFVLCTGIFAGTFLVSTSYDYRLIFLIPMLPFLVDQARAGARRAARVLGATGVGLVVFGMNRGTARPLHPTVLVVLLKAAGHVDLWALLWTVCFFMGAICAARRRPGVRADSSQLATGGLVQEPV
ncbi:MAG TPA: hypothetical protein VGD59_04820 [Acidisarcina sp.]